MNEIGTPPMERRHRVHEHARAGTPAGPAGADRSSWSDFVGSLNVHHDAEGLAVPLVIGAGALLLATVAVAVIVG